ncbi:hypothetical protein AAJ76_940008822 [Vairimorpha ceranae]|uniref:Uncharacterized protein n=1 Tax=Vairimorpha ceranae TaxID=40302 RepID=A0A0F9WBI6_9MICR|nr:hypothetical protein AAJ76_940008822 [Vairimorpha ceranae]KKO74250.1 hypothetical protein AAJ76_940008822 [Vairimorpha ceranae]
MLYTGKCKKPTKEGHKIVKKEQNILQVLKKDTEEYIKDLEN